MAAHPCWRLPFAERQVWQGKTAQATLGENRAMLDTTQSAALGFDAERLARIEPFLRQAYVDGGRLPMAQLIVARDGKPVYSMRCGTMGEGREDVREDALFRIASMTKPVTSIAFMQLVEQCKVALEEPVTKVFPEFANFRSSPAVAVDRFRSIPASRPDRCGSSTC